MLRMKPPENETELLHRAKNLSGMTLKELAERVHQNVPEHLFREKGWIGQLLESVLGTTAATLAEPDFQELKIELKTIPVTAQNNPLESTFICTVSQAELLGQTWPTSHVWKKLAKVLWVPIMGEKKAEVATRCVGKPFLWSPSPQQEALLKQDWEEFADAIALGKIQSISARQGVYLQVRPKAAHSRIVSTAIGEEGDIIKINPRGFYLRASFTREILNNVECQA